MKATNQECVAPVWHAGQTRQVKQAVRRVIEGSVDPDQSRESWGFLETLIDTMALAGTDPSTPVRSLMTHLNSRWGAPLVVILRNGPYRFSTLRHLLNTMSPNPPITHRMLTLNLRTFERDGLVKRHEYPGNLSRVEYELSDIGRHLSDIMLELVWCCVSYAPAIRVNRERYDQANDE